MAGSIRAIFVDPVAGPRSVHQIRGDGHGALGADLEDGRADEGEAQA
jgi:hypothetical protein